MSSGNPRKCAKAVKLALEATGVHSKRRLIHLTAAKKRNIRRKIGRVARIC